MRNPWLKKNPVLSMWLSGANAIAGAARSRASAEARRQTTAMMNQGMKQVVEFWTAALSAPSPRRRRRRKP